MRIVRIADADGHPNLCAASVERARNMVALFRKTKQSRRSRVAEGRVNEHHQNAKTIKEAKR